MILAALLASVSASLLIFMSARYFGPGGYFEKKKNINKRISQSQNPDALDPSLLKKKDNLSELNAIKKLLSRYEPSKDIALLLRTAKVKISVAAFLLIGAVLFIVSFNVLKISLNPLPAFLIALPVGFLPTLYLKMARKHYLRKFSEFLPNALSIISSSIKVGHGLEAALEAVAKTAPYPVSEEFQTALGEVQLGITLSNALENLYDRIKSAELKIFVTGISVHQDLGGSLAEILDNLEKTIRERFALLREIETLSSQGKFSALVLFLIPFVIVGLYMWGSREMFLTFVKSPYGKMIVWACVGLQAIGFLGIQRVVRLKD